MLTLYDVGAQVKSQYKMLIQMFYNHKQQFKKKILNPFKRKPKITPFLSIKINVKKGFKKV